MQDFLNKKIVIGVCGGIAAYKTAYLIRELTRLGAKVRVVMTASAQQFITPMTLQALSGHEVRSELFDSQAERAMGHIELARWADYLLIAPASANCLAKMAHGLADDLLTTMCLVSESPIFVCPAMNRSMWSHPATQANCELLRERGVIFIGPEDGSQACGEEGYGRMSEVNHVLNALRLQSVHRLLQGKKVLITAGPTREAIDPVRYLTNRSSGKMGYALAEAAVRAGAEVILVSGPTSQTPPPGVIFYPVECAMTMYSQVLDLLQPGMIFIGAAAVADYSVSNPAGEKIKKHIQTTLNLALIPNPDILAAVAASKKPAFVVGFAAETNDLLRHAQEKLVNKKLDMIIANQVSEQLGFDRDENQFIIITKNKQIDTKLTNKVTLAGQIIAILAANLQNVTHLER